jgi:hypothetical protein
MAKQNLINKEFLISEYKSNILYIVTYNMFETFYSRRRRVFLFFIFEVK